MRKSWRQRLAIGAGAVALIAASSVAATIYGLRSVSPECVDTILASAESPDHRVVGAVIDRGCGATVGFIRAVVLYDTSDGFASDDDNIVYMIDGQGEIAIRWVDKSRFVIGSLGSQSSHYKTLNSWNGIAISYD